MNGKREVEVAINSLREEGFSEECTEALAGIWRWKESGKMQREVTNAAAQGNESGKQYAYKIIG